MGYHATHSHSNSLHSNLLSILCTTLVGRGSYSPFLLRSSILLVWNMSLHMSIISTHLQNLCGLSAHLQSPTFSVRLPVLLTGCLPTCIHFPPLLYHAKTNILASEKMAQSALGILLFRYSFIWNHLLCLTNEVPPALHDMLEWQHCRSSLTYAKDGVSGRNQHHVSHTAMCRWLYTLDNQHLNARSLEQKRYC